jgi:glycosyltransferase involved in cell wall biosynthesis
MMPLPISVVIPAYNRPAMVARAVQSALSQRPAPPAEVVVVDDASTDATAEAARAAGARVIRHAENRGQSAARNTGIRVATQEWVALLDSDDEWLPGHLAALWPHAPGRVILGSTVILCGPDPSCDRLWGRERETPHLLHSPADVLASGNALVTSSVLVRRDALVAAAGFRESVRLAEDLDLWMRVLEGGTGYVSPAVTVRYAMHEAQISGDRRAMWAAHRAIVRAHRGRPWCTDAVVARAEGILLWHESYDAWREGSRRDALRHAGAVARDAHRASAVLRYLATHVLLRRRAGRYTRDGGASVRVWTSSPDLLEQARRRYGGAVKAEGAAGGLDALRRPAGLTVTDSPTRALLARLGGSRVVRWRADGGEGRSPGAPLQAHIGITRPRRQGRLPLLRSAWVKARRTARPVARSTTRAGTQ